MNKFVCFFITTILTFLLFFNINSSYANDDKDSFSSEQAYQGFLSYILQDYKSAIKYFSNAIELETNNYIYFHQRGLAYYNIKKYKKAILDFNKSIELNPKFAEAYYYRSLAKEKIRDYQGAEEDKKLVLTMVPEYKNLNHKKEHKQIECSASGQSGQGFLSILKGDYKSAIKYFSKAIELEPNNAVSYHQRGIAYYNIGNYKNALNDFNKTIDLDPNHTDAYGNRSLVKMELKDYRGALDDIEKVLKVAPNDQKSIKQKEMIIEKINEK